MARMAETRRTPGLDRFLEKCHRRTYPAKSTVINAGDISEELYYLESGSVSVVIEDDDGHEIILAYLNAGDFFGEIGMFDENRRRSAWVRTRTKCDIASIGYDRLRALSSDYPEGFVRHDVADGAPPT